MPVDGQPHRIHAPWVVRFPAMNVAHNTLRARRNRSHAVIVARMRVPRSFHFSWPTICRAATSSLNDVHSSRIRPSVIRQTVMPRTSTFAPVAGNP